MMRPDLRRRLERLERRLQAQPGRTRWERAVHRLRTGQAKSADFDQLLQRVQADFEADLLYNARFVQVRQPHFQWGPMYWGGAIIAFPPDGVYAGRIDQPRAELNDIAADTFHADLSKYGKREMLTREHSIPLWITANIVVRILARREAALRSSLAEHPPQPSTPPALKYTIYAGLPRYPWDEPQDG